MENSIDQFRFHHLGVAVRDLPEAVDSYRSLFGYELDSGPFDDPIQNVSVCFLRRNPNDPMIEPVAPLGPNSPINGYLKRGTGAYHICYEVPDIYRAIEHMEGHGCMVLSGPVPAVAFEMRHIAWLMTETNLLVELVEASRESILARHTDAT